MGAFLRLMVSKQKPAVSSCASSAQSCTDHPVSQPQHHLAPPSLGGPDPTCCIVHRLEEAIELTEALHLTSEQKSKIAELTKKQSDQSKALCAKQHELHKTTHSQILALLTEDQQKTLKEILPTGPEHRGHGDMDVPGHEGTPRGAMPEPLASRLAPSVPATTAGRGYTPLGRLGNRCSVAP